jgi:mRNA-degrading endonuclease RelE of RelBE toxin-antitoxin system
MAVFVVTLQHILSFNLACTYTQNGYNNFKKGWRPHMTEVSTPWAVDFTGSARKQKEKLPKEIYLRALALKADLEWKGPERTDWPHYGKLTGKGKNQDYRHCHLNKGHPTYVAVWKVVDMEVQIMEIRYVGTHENADYRRIN